MSRKNRFKDLLHRVWTLAVVCSQWGDSGKGKLVDLLSEWADIIVRGTGGDNAGHTIVVNGKKFIAHLIPSGILRDRDGKVNVIGSGVAFNPYVAIGEMNTVVDAGGSHDNLMISLAAKLILPQHIILDRIREDSAGRSKIGTTGRGIGPCYTDHYARIGLTVNDMLNSDIFVRKLKANLKEKLVLLRQYDPAAVREVMYQDHLQNGVYWRNETRLINVDEIIERYRVYGQRLRDFICDTDPYLQGYAGKKKMLLEGAQGLMLSVDRGSYPFVTSSDCSADGLARGAGLSGRHLDLVLQIAKAFYMTRVGEGPFPTEFGGAESAKWCDSRIGEEKINRQSEREAHPLVSVNDRNEFYQGIAIRQVGDEYGATTGRPRRCGRLDLPILRYAINQNGPFVVYTKLDVMSGCDEIEICTSYIYEGPPVKYGNREIKHGDSLAFAIPQTEIMAFCRPVYRKFPGWGRPISQARSLQELPRQLREILSFISDSTMAVPKILSIGADREETIIL